MRCVYCMPAAGIPKLKHDEILSYEELVLIAETAVEAGIEKIRVTGGEPLVRKGVVSFLSRLAVIPGLQQLVLTTNGLLLDEMAESLRLAGVQRLNISLDSLQPEVFAAITRGGDVQRVMSGINAAEQAGFPLKINMVVMRGINDEEILDFAAMTLERPVMVRFIEYMPAIRNRDWESRVMPGKTILDKIGRRFSLSQLEPDATANRTAGPARTFRIAGAAGTVGVITPVTGHFCENCNRIRVTASGKARSCLFSDAFLDLKPILAEGDGEKLREALCAIVANKPGKHSMTDEEQHHTPFAMSSIGG